MVKIMGKNHASFSKSQNVWLSLETHTKYVDYVNGLLQISPGKTATHLALANKQQENGRKPVIFITCFLSRPRFI